MEKTVTQRSNSDASIEDTAIHTTDPLSLLPEALVHHIIFFLQLRGGSYLHFIQVMAPILEFPPNPNFRFSYGGREDSYATDKFIKFVDDSLHNLRRCHLAKDKAFSLFLPYYQQQLYSCMDDWIGLVTENYIEEINISILPFAWAIFSFIISKCESLYSKSSQAQEGRSRYIG